MRRATRPRFPPEAKPLPAHAQSPPNPVCLNQPLIRHRDNGDSLLPAFFALRSEHHRETHKASPSKSPRPAAKAQSSRARSSFALRAQSIAATVRAREDPSLLPGNRESSVKPAHEWELRLDTLSSLHRQLNGSNRSSHSSAGFTDDSRLPGRSDGSSRARTVAAID